MNIYIGQQQDSGVVRYISTSEYSNRRITPILRNFYSKESRVSALIELGNLNTVGPTPYGKSDGYNDSIHCYAEIRDDKKGKGSRLPKYSSETEFLSLEGHLFLYKTGKWHYHYTDGLSDDLPEKLPDISTKPLEGLELFYLDEKGEISRSYNRDIKSWNEIKVKSDEKKSPAFIFRNNKLITTINHPLNQ